MRSDIACFYRSWARFLDFFSLFAFACFASCLYFSYRFRLLRGFGLEHYEVAVAVSSQHIPWSILAFWQGALLSRRSPLGSILKIFPLIAMAILSVYAWEEPLIWRPLVWRYFGTTSWYKVAQTESMPFFTHRYSYPPRWYTAKRG